MGIENGSPHVSRLKIKRLLAIALVCGVLVTSVVLVDINLTGYAYNIPDPTFSDDFPDILFFYNISEAITSNIFSFILVLQSNHSGQNHIIPRAISFCFRFKDATDGSNLSEFINAVLFNVQNSTLSFYNYDYDQVNLNVAGWWIPSRLYVAFNDLPDANSVRYGLSLELILVNIFGDPFDGHELSVQLQMNVTYSRWWYGLAISKSYQTVEYVFNLPDDGVVVIQSLEYGT